VRSERASIDEFDSALARGVFGSKALEPVFAWHGWFLSYNLEEQTSNGLVLPWHSCITPAAERHPKPGNAGLAEAGASPDEGRTSSAFNPVLVAMKITKKEMSVIPYARF
jgi:hypothetical protein